MIGTEWPLTGLGVTGSVVPGTGSPRHARCMRSSASSRRLPRSCRLKPVTVKSSGRVPTPMPSTNRPPETWSSVAACFASITGSRVAASRMSVMRPIRSVAPAAAASVTSSSKLG